MIPYPHINNYTDYDVVILANGAFPKDDIPLQLLQKAPLVVCCDGAIAHWPQADVAIGDGDSVPPELREKFIQINEQDDNDLTKATRYCLSQGWHRIVYLGATGCREDHTLGNISLIARYFLEMGVEPLMATDYGWFVVGNGNASFSSFPGQQVSIFNMTCHTLKSKLLRWPCHAFTQWWQGTLNEALLDEFEVESDGCYLVFRTYLPKG